ncbi:hypothetical protein HLI01_22355 [Rhizobium laguerreae]|uniref:hypothetical protein n=1 Tax=Rhizobium laguerreae TaxID=1076926 RepID=UPI00147882C2|nr:hypothetical protein [Rhizobium laguerreae]NNH59480.1 hypothetical protein [Rhizobium laguerreae]
MSEWIEHDGKGMPVPAETLVLVRFWGGEETSVPNQAHVAGECWKTSTMFPESTITHYRSISPTPPQDLTQSEDAA